jgi:hypothetical protein
VTVEELVEDLGQFDPGAEVRMAQQPSWPFEYSVSELVAAGVGRVVYIVEAAQLGYLPGEVASAIGWR